MILQRNTTASKYVQKSPISRETQMTIRDHLTPIRMATIKEKKKKINNKIGNTSVGKDMEKLTGNPVLPVEL